KLVFSAFIAFWASITTIFALQALAASQSEKTTAQSEKPTEAGRISLDELAAHSTDKDCWIAVEGKVYDITAYLPSHPVPPAVLLAWCGKEATEGMRTKGYGRDHSPAAWGMLEAYRVGELAQ